MEHIRKIKIFILVSSKNKSQFMKMALIFLFVKIKKEKLMTVYENAANFPLFKIKNYLRRVYLTWHLKLKFISLHLLIIVRGKRRMVKKSNEKK